MYRFAFVALALALLGCAGHAEDSGDRPQPPRERCAEGLLVVDGPVTSIRARYPDASPPDRLRRYSTMPTMFIIVEAGGWLRFEPFDGRAVPAGGVATIEAHDVSTGEPLCPLEVEAGR